MKKGEQEFALEINTNIIIIFVRTVNFILFVELAESSVERAKSANFV